LEAVLPADLKGLYLVSDGAFDTSGQWFVAVKLTNNPGVISRAKPWSWL
jgi:hypothetical protein